MLSRSLKNRRKLIAIFFLFNNSLNYVHLGGLKVFCVQAKVLNDYFKTGSTRKSKMLRSIECLNLTKLFCDKERGKSLTKALGDAVVKYFPQLSTNFTEMSCTQ